MAQISKERLNQIAAKKLAALGIPTLMAPDGVTLLGSIRVRPQAMVNPATGQSIERIDFVVEGHDQLWAAKPPCIAALGPMVFFDFDRTALLLARISERLARRQSAALEHEARMRAHKIPTRIDAERIVALGQVDLGPDGKVLIEGSDEGLIATRAMRQGSPQPLELGDIPLDLNDFPDSVDLELSLSRYISEAEGRPAEARKPRRAAGPATGVMAAASAQSARYSDPVPKAAAQRQVTPALTQPSKDAARPAGLGIQLGALIQRLDPTLRVVNFMAVQEVSVGGRRLRFTLEQQGDEFVGKVQAPGELLWEGSVDVEHFVGLTPLLTSVLGRPIQLDDQPEAQSAGPAVVGAGAAGAAVAIQIEGYASPNPGEIPAHAMPIAGECWVMDIRMLATEQGQVKYRSTNANGQPYGEPLLLAEVSFNQAFTNLGGGSYRYSVEVLAIETTQVIYVALDTGRQKFGAQQQMLASSFVSSFLPEAAAY